MWSFIIYNGGMDIDPQNLTITQALGDEEIRRGLTQACYRQIERLNPLLNAFITVVPPDRGKNQGNHKGPLAGIPIAVKDLFETAGIVTTAGSLFFKDYTPKQDADPVEKLKAAGADIVGKTNTHEIALGITGINPHYGTPKNPWDSSRIPGGSSSGSAVAVAAGMCMAALGTDTGGSIRIPASLCGVVGLKPTYGRISLRGVFPLSRSLDHVGPLTRSVKDAALLLQVLAGYDSKDPSSINAPTDDYLRDLDVGIRGLRVALLTGEDIDSVDTEVLKAVREAALVFESLGAKVEKVKIPWLHEASLANTKLVLSDGAAYHQKRLAQNPELFGPDVRARLEEGQAISTTEYELAKRQQVEFRGRAENFFNQYDLLLTPTTGIPAIPIDEISNSADVAPALTRFTAPFNLTGLPALSIPCGFNNDGLPLGLQLISGPWQEAKVLQAGYAFEASTDWHTHTALI